MQLLMLRSMWPAPDDPQDMVEQVVSAGDTFDGVEGPIPAAADERRLLKSLLEDHGLCFVAEATTGLDENATDDWWVPRPDKTIDDHLADLRFTVEHAAEMGAHFVTTMCGYDAWSWDTNVAFFEGVMQLQRETGVTIAVESHRCRSTYNPWTMRDLLRHFPEMRMTCDYSHWVAVCERLLESERDVLELCASRAEHIHCRVGEPQRAQVTDPRAPEFERTVRLHESWWDMIWDAHAASGRQFTTMTCEWGHQGYTPLLPYTGQPIVDLWEITCWFARRQRARFTERFGVAKAGAAADPRV